jgi:hypothetical protein
MCHFNILVRRVTLVRQEIYKSLDVPLSPKINGVLCRTIFSRRCLVLLRKFPGDNSAMKFIYGFLGEVLPTGDVDGFKPAFFPPAFLLRQCR